jgi:hypothetical protein
MYRKEYNQHEQNNCHCKLVKHQTLAVLLVCYCRQPERRLAVDGRTSHLAAASPRQAAACTPRCCTLGAPAAVPQKILSSSAVMHTHIENMFRE